jgi:thiol-disulfide isomerase/thioredoxin
MKNKSWFISVIVLVAIIVVSFMFLKSDNSPGLHDEFAQCLTDSGAKMFGAYWCPHCKDQKAMFENSWKYVDYIECSLPNNAGQTKTCIDAKIDGYPTWEFEDGSRLSGALSFEKLSELTGCNINSES